MHQPAPQFPARDRLLLANYAPHPIRAPHLPPGPQPAVQPHCAQEIRVSTWTWEELLHLYQPGSAEEESSRSACPLPQRVSPNPLSLGLAPCLCGTLALSPSATPLSLSPPGLRLHLSASASEAGGKSLVNRRMAPGAPGADTRFRAGN